MRHVIAYEGVDHGFGYILAPGALKFPEGPVPLTWNFDHSNPASVWGHADDFRREEDGSITAEITFVDDVTEKIDKICGDVGATFWANKIHRNIKTDPTTVVTGHIKAAYLSPSVPWRLSKKEEEDGQSRDGESAPESSDRSSP